VPGYVAQIDRDRSTENGHFNARQNRTNINEKVITKIIPSRDIAAMYEQILFANIHSVSVNRKGKPS
jgi:hypothetical protein